MRFGLDANVLLRALLNDHPRQSPTAHAFLASFDEERRGHVGIPAVLEIFWVLRSRYRVPHQALCEAMRDLLTIRYLEIENSGAVALALSMYQRRRSGFQDALLAALNAEAGCDFTYTFDCDAVKALPAMKLLEDAS
ncbi:PIN domain-containing protein [Aquibium carbonis]|uniref:PIN domain-containing protein n=1 Tax=Aquibium carbonis TaxID=2495581 RepID=A0A3S0AA79_9HYPH|nr:PIN domain-containing protein [Aquibium carbonis]RST88205.1 PIN domain-containing protein [Aquibium carbonis]